MVVASYSASEGGVGGNEIDGVVMVWSLKHALNHAEYRLNCQSAVTCVSFSEFNPVVLIGGCYSGQLVLWDVRTGPNPVQHTPLSSLSHTHPVYGMKVVGTKNAHNVVSVSTDGQMCVWNVENLLQPVEVLTLQSLQSKSAAVSPVAATSLVFPESETNNFCVGSEDGSIYTGIRHGRFGERKMKNT